MENDRSIPETNGQIRKVYRQKVVQFLKKQSTLTAQGTQKITKYLFLNYTDKKFIFSTVTSYVLKGSASMK